MVYRIKYLWTFRPAECEPHITVAGLNGLGLQSGSRLVLRVEFNVICES